MRPAPVRIISIGFELQARAAGWGDQRGQPMRVSLSLIWYRRSRSLQRLMLDLWSESRRYTSCIFLSAVLPPPARWRSLHRCATKPYLWQRICAAFRPSTRGVLHPLRLLWDRAAPPPPTPAAADSCYHQRRCSAHGAPITCDSVERGRPPPWYLPLALWVNTSPHLPPLRHLGACFGYLLCAGNKHISHADGHPLTQG